MLAYADCLVLDRGRVPDGLFDALRAELSDEEILELTYITALYLQHAVMSRALRTEFDDRDEPVVEVAAPEGAEDGLRHHRAPRPEVRAGGRGGQRGHAASARVSQRRTRARSSSTSTAACCRGVSRGGAARPGPALADGGKGLASAVPQLEAEEGEQGLAHCGDPPNSCS